ncbi:MAG: transglutaminase domain-containing protein [Elusimicrobia bacterium]|nr:transglutaminase domain-containing protein [Elusimicrobiota bacterium]
MRAALSLICLALALSYPSAEDVRAPNLPTLKDVRKALDGSATTQEPTSKPITPATLTPYHSHPQSALAAGAQSKIDIKQVADILKEAGVAGSDGLKDAARIHQWIEDNFASSPDGGKTSGKYTAAKLLESRTLAGCHDWALVLATLLRSAGYPALMADTASIPWMMDVRAGRPVQEYRGHVFVEAYIDGRWVLLDSTGRSYIADYDPANPFIPMQVGGDNRFCVMFKGLDPSGYGLDSIRLGDYMVRFSKAIDPMKLNEKNGRVLDLPRAGAELPALSEEILARPMQAYPSRAGVVLQFPKADLDIHIEKTKGGGYSAHLYRYGRVFAESVKTLSFSNLGELRSYLRSLEPTE